MARKLPTFLQDNEPEQLLRATERERDRMMGLVLLYCGLRVAELCAVKIEHIDFSRRLLWVREGKGKRDRCIPIHKKIIGPLRGWIGSRRQGYVFASRQGGGRMGTRAVQLRIKAWADKAGLLRAFEPRAVTPHKFRHACLSRLLESGATIHEVQRIAGHANIQTTSIYLHCMNDDRLREAIDRL